MAKFLKRIDPSDVLVILGIAFMISGVALYEWRIAIILAGVALVSLGVLLSFRGES